MPVINFDGKSFVGGYVVSEISYSITYNFYVSGIRFSYGTFELADSARDELIKLLSEERPVDANKMIEELKNKISFIETKLRHEQRQVKARTKIMNKLAKRVEELEANQAPSSLSEALNSGDGSYHP